MLIFLLLEICPKNEWHSHNKRVKIYKISVVLRHIAAFTTVLSEKSIPTKTLMVKHLYQYKSFKIKNKSKKILLLRSFRIKFARHFSTDVLKSELIKRMHYTTTYHIT